MKAIKVGWGGVEIPADFIQANSTPNSWTYSGKPTAFLWE